MNNKFFLLAITSLLSIMPMVAKSQTAFGITMGASPLGGIITTNMGLVGGFSNGVKITSITVSVPGTATSNAVYSFYDFFQTNQAPLVYSNTVAFTNATIVDPYTNTVLFTNSLGRTQSNVTIGRATFYTNVTAVTTTNTLPTIGAISAQPGVPITIPVNWYLDRGFTVKGVNNNLGTIITVVYE